MQKAIDVLEDRSCAGYDIGCSFGKTIESSSIAKKYRLSGTRTCVNAFHGYTHCYLCQLHHHPNVICGAGLEDFETMERIFSSSNQLATVTRYASSYRRRLFIDAYFRQWDIDKYSNSGLFILGNYRQALDAIDKDSASLASSLKSLGVDHAALDMWEQDEVSYFAMVGQEQPRDVHAIAYVELLQDLQALETQRSNTTSAFILSAPSDYSFSTATSQQVNYSSDAASTARLESKRRLVNERHAQVLQDVITLEVQLNITSRWVPSSREYRETQKYITERRYHRALDKLHRLVVLRLFELHKLNLGNTGNVTIS